MNRSKPWLAFFWSFVIPGAGLVYLRLWKRGILNFLLVQAVVLILVFGIGESTLVEHVHYVLLALAAASAGYAHGVALSVNRALGHMP